MDEILEILEKDARATPKEIAKMTRKSEQAVKKAISEYEKKGVIIKYKTIVNKELLKDENCTDVLALIEVSISPERGSGFDKVAERIYSFPEVKSCYLLSGGYDLLLIIEGKSIHTIGNFVAEKLSTIDHVRGTQTHFILKKYKDGGDILRRIVKDKRIAISM
ncbi:MAG: Lrp/AsnC family transcriptional regulator [bacterium]|nr:Lrp/AsnC family transcriptional regulator [Candidatus Auribacterota bacterium]MDD5645356.1 Lrp/AsnC family transcriptional regulator [bacterium]